MVRLQCGMCVGVFPSCVNTVQSKKCSDFSRLVAQRNVTGSFCASEKKGEVLPEKKIDTRAVLVLRLKQRGRKMEI